MVTMTGDTPDPPRTTPRTATSKKELKNTASGDHEGPDGDNDEDEDEDETAYDQETVLTQFFRYRRPSIRPRPL